MGNEIALIGKIKVFERDGKQWTTSLNIADVFGKDHRHILEKIDNLECSEQFAETNFRLGEYLDKNNQMRKMFELSRDGFSFLVMGFTGAKAAQFKEAYIEAFNKMESHIREQSGVNDRFLITYERFHNDFLEIQKKNQEILESVSGNVYAIGGRVEKVEFAISEIKSEISNFKNVVPLNRRQISKSDRRVHRLFVFDHFTGQCPICGTQIVDASRQEKDSFCIDHEINRHERSLDQTWAICKQCNRKKSNSTLHIGERDCRSLFDAYHTQLRIWKAKKPVQLQIETK